jgi:hypothetical protein
LAEQFHLVMENKCQKYELGDAVSPLTIRVTIEQKLPPCQRIDLSRTKCKKFVLEWQKSKMTNRCVVFDCGGVLGSNGLPGSALPSVFPNEPESRHAELNAAARKAWNKCRVGEFGARGFWQEILSDAGLEDHNWVTYNGGCLAFDFVLLCFACLLVNFLHTFKPIGDKSCTVKPLSRFHFIYY